MGAPGGLEMAEARRRLGAIVDAFLLEEQAQRKERQRGPRPGTRLRLSLLLQEGVGVLVPLLALVLIAVGRLLSPGSRTEDGEWPVLGASVAALGCSVILNAWLARAQRAALGEEMAARIREGLQRFRGLLAVTGPGHLAEDSSALVRTWVFTCGCALRRPLGNPHQSKCQNEGSVHALALHWRDRGRGAMLRRATPSIEVGDGCAFLRCSSWRVTSWRCPRGTRRRPPFGSCTMRMTHMARVGAGTRRLTLCFCAGAGWRSGRTNTPTSPNGPPFRPTRPSYCSCAGTSAASGEWGDGEMKGEVDRSRAAGYHDSVPA